MEIELMVKEDFHINQKEWQEIEEYENEYRKNVKKCEKTGGHRSGNKTTASSI